MRVNDLLCKIDDLPDEKVHAYTEVMIDVEGVGPCNIKSVEVIDDDHPDGSSTVWIKAEST